MAVHPDSLLANVIGSGPCQVLALRQGSATMQLHPSTLLALAMAVAGSAAALQPDGHAIQNSVSQLLPGPAPQTRPLECVDAIQMAPVIQMTKAGATLLGESLSTVVIYSNGLITMSSIDPRNGGSSAQMLHANPLDVQDLKADLGDLNVGSICDARITVYDVPLTTVSVSRGASDGMTHSYSYWLGTDHQREVESVILDFIMNASMETEK